MGWKAVLACAVSLLLAYAPMAPASSPAAVGKIITKGQAEVNGAATPSEATVFSGDRITTAKDTTTGLTLTGGDQVFLPALSAAQFTRAGGQLTVTLQRGALAVVSRSAEPVVVEANGVHIRAASARGGVYEVAVNGTALKVMARRGNALVTASNRTVEVKEGTTLDATAGPAEPAPTAGAGGLSALWTAVLVTSSAAGFTGLALGVQASQRTQPQDCTVVSPAGIVCP